MMQNSETIFRLERLKKKFMISFEEDAEVFFFSPGRIELLGNHTDHNLGKVLVMTINLALLAAVKKNNSNFIRASFDQDDEFIVVDLEDTLPKKEESHQSIALIRGVVSGMKNNGYDVSGFDIKIESAIPQGAGISSSAAFELVFCELINQLFNEGRISKLEKAIIAQKAEIDYFGKPCGLLDQVGISFEGINHIDFYTPHHRMSTNLAASLDEYSLILINTPGSHANLTSYYSEIKSDMQKVASYFGHDYLREGNESEFYRALPELLKVVGGRAILRSMHFFEENKRVDKALIALQNQDIELFLRLINESGQSSYDLLQNCYYPEDKEQGLSLAITITKKILRRGAVRVHGGGFAGTILTIVHQDDANDYISKMSSLFGASNIYRVTPNFTGTTILD